MYRVELKAPSPAHLSPPSPSVPNVPCGVERRPSFCKPQPVATAFLMYRVELKGKKGPEEENKFSSRS